MVVKTGYFGDASCCDSGNIDRLFLRCFLGVTVVAQASYLWRCFLGVTVVAQASYLWRCFLGVTVVV